MASIFPEAQRTNHSVHRSRSTTLPRRSLMVSAVPPVFSQPPMQLRCPYWCHAFILPDDEPRPTVPSVRTSAGEAEPASFRLRPGREATLEVASAGADGCLGRLVRVHRREGGVDAS